VEPDQSVLEWDDHGVCPAQPSNNGQADHAPGPLSRHVPGLAPIPIECPYAPDVQLAADTDGRMHLLTLADTEPVGDAIELLMIASAWSQAHANLVSAVASHSVRPDLAPVVHVMTRHPKRVRRLLDTDLRVHAIGQPEQRGGWVCMELN
jgi:hypothetical protein